MLDELFDKVQNAGMWVAGIVMVGAATWLYPYIKQQLAPQAPQASARPVASIGVAQTAALIRGAEPNVRDANGWATDLLSVLQAHRIPQSKENVCSVIAVVDQESGFVANPAVPNLGKLSEKAVIDKLNKIPVLSGQAESFLDRFPDKQNSFMQRIRKARTERDLDLAYRDLIAGLEKYAAQYKLGMLVQNGFARDFIESRNEIDTIGSMQVSVDFALQHETSVQKKSFTLQDIYNIRDRMYTRKGGMYYGTLLLLGYDTGYDKKIYRFADFNAGRYSSRNAAFQKVISELLKQPVATDGDLLIYKADGDVALTMSGTEKALANLVQKYALGLKEWEIRRDLLQEKHLYFNSTVTYKTVMALYRKVKNTTPAYAMVPVITLTSEKTSNILTTQKFANSVNNRYQRCLSQN